MLRSSLLALSLLLASSAAAEEFYVPLSGNAATEVRIVNASERSTIVVIELMETAAPTAAKTTQITLAGGESAQFSGSEGYGALRINANERLLVTAVSLGAVVPVLDPRDAIAEGTITASQSGVGVVNPDIVPAMVTVSLHRGDQIVDETLLEVPARGTRLIRMDRVFTASATEADQSITFSAPQRVLPFGYNEHGFTTATPAAPSVGRRRAVRFPLAPVVPQTVVLTPSKDNTLYQTTDGSLSNGSGIHLFAGSTNRSELRRALIAFDLASQIPPGRQITRVVLTLHVSQTISGPESMELHRVAADWGQGSSNAGAARDGGGTASRQGDATWIHTFFPDRRWSKPGGDFAAAADATAQVEGIGDSSWGSSAVMIARVQGWLDQPSTNFGWIILGNEATSATTKRFDSREIAPSSTRPTLTIDFK